MSVVIHGFRAIKRCTSCIVSELLKYEEFNFDLLYFDYKYNTDNYLKSSEFEINQKIVRVPLRLLIHFWKRFSWPRLEMYLSKYDLYYTNEFYFPPLRKTPILATIHGLPHKVVPEKMTSQVKHSVDQGVSFTLKHADYLVAVSETSKKEIIQHLGVDPERIFVVTHGVDPYFRKRKSQKAVLNRLSEAYGFMSPYILYVGAIGIHKNIMGILGAYESLSSRIQHNLVFAGPPDSAWDKAKGFVKENKLSDRVHFLGNIEQSGDRLLDLYNGAELFVFPSFCEAWTSPPLEAMACGTPVITSNCSSLPETVGEAAIQVEPNDTEELANAMETVLSDGALRLDLITKGFEHASKHTWEKAAEKLIHVFENVLAKGPWERAKV
jgi:glycosyltransferase involved in cell wall biosynthesis